MSPAELPTGRGECRERSDYAFILPIELPIEAVRDDPNCSDGPSFAMERNQEGFDKSRGVAQRRETSVRQIHELGCVFVNTNAARAGIPRHRSIPRRCEDSGYRFPPK